MKNYPFTQHWTPTPESIALPKWRGKHRVLVDDVFSHVDEFVDRVFACMALCPQHEFYLATEHAERMAEYLNSRLGCDNVPHEVEGLYFSSVGKGEDWKFCEEIIDGLSDDRNLLPLPNLALGVIIRTQTEADERIPYLLRCPAALRWLSMEPREEVVLPEDSPYCQGCGPRFTPVNYGETYCADCANEDPDAMTTVVWSGLGVDWVIVGGESGPGARPMHPDWARSVRDQCQAAGVPFFFKQWGDYSPDASRFQPGERFPDSSVMCCASGNSHCWEAYGGLGAKDVWMHRVGKRAAGRLLDGRAWDELPTLNTEAAR